MVHSTLNQIESVIYFYIIINMPSSSNIVWKLTVTTFFLVPYGMAQENTNKYPDSDTTCKQLSYIPRPLAPDVRKFSPFYAVAFSRTVKTEKIDNVCYTYFEDEKPFINIMSIVYKDGSNSQAVLHKADIDGYPGIAEAKIIEGGEDVIHDYTLVPVCGFAVFPLYRCLLKGNGDLLDVGKEVDSMVALAGSPNVTSECGEEIYLSYDRNFYITDSESKVLILPQKHKPKCITTYTTPSGKTLTCIGADKVAGGNTLYISPCLLLLTLVYKFTF